MRKLSAKGPITSSIAALVGGLLWALFALNTTATAQTYLDEYKAYNQALDAGDQDAAAAHGYAAWQAAEVELGDDNLTAVLAYNYGQLVLYTETEKSVIALRRAEELREAGIADLPTSELELYLAYAEFIVGDKRRRQANALRDALKRIDAEGIGASADTAAMWLQLASADLSKKRFSKAYDAAIKAEVAIATISPDNYQRRAEALLIGGMAKIIQRSSDPNEILQGNKLLVRASRLFPKQESIDTFDPILGQIIAWNAAANSALNTFSNFAILNGMTPGQANGAVILNTNAFFKKTVSLQTCKIEWESRPEPSYPASASNMGYIGAAIIGYNFGDDTSLHDVTVIAEVPSRTFGKNVVKAMSKWRLKNIPLDKPDCRNNFAQSYSFVFEP